MMEVGRARLITSPTDPMAYTAYRDVDARTALTRGLADYLRSMLINAQGGRQIRLKHVLQTWSEPEVEVTFPSAVVYSTEPGVYDASRFTPGVNARERVAAPDGSYVVAIAEFLLNVGVEIWATDPVERREIVAACEEMFNPVDFMYGFTLELPYYYNQRAVYSMQSMQYLDTEEDAMKRHRKASFVLAGQLPIVQLRKIAGAQPRLVLDKIGSDVIVTLTTE